MSAQAKTGVEVERLPELPKKRRGFICTKCGSPQCEAGKEDEKNPPCAVCGYLGFAQDRDYSDDEMRAYATAALAAEREEVERLMGDLRASDEDRLELHKANRLLADEAVRMREALGSINDLYDDQCNSSQLASRMYDASCIARAALSPSQGNPK